tara:strand:+ start:195 stop:335 length:141 start_codon:yes stop_codon:yes gene_type:complete
MKRLLDSKLWKTGNSFVVTVPKKIVKKLNIKVGDELEVVIKKDEKE